MLRGSWNGPLQAVAIGASLKHCAHICSSDPSCKRFSLELSPGNCYTFQTDGTPKHSDSCTYAFSKAGKLRRSFLAQCVPTVCLPCAYLFKPRRPQEDQSTLTVGSACFLIALLHLWSIAVVLSCCELLLVRASSAKHVAQAQAVRKSGGRSQKPAHDSEVRRRFSFPRQATIEHKSVPESQYSSRVSVLSKRAREA